MTFCLSDPLLGYVLGQVEKSPQATFTEAELKGVSSDEFEHLLKARLLKFKQSEPDQETFPCPTPCDRGCDRLIGKIRQEYQAICPEYSDVKPLRLTEGDLKRYAFDMERFLAKMKTKNQLVGLTHAINDRVFFVGERSVGQERVAVLLVLLRNQREAESTLLGLSNQIGTYHRVLVLLPLCDTISQDLFSRLEKQSIVVARFEEAFSKSDLAIDFARLERRGQKTGPQYPPKTPKQQKDFDTYDYLCEDRLWLTGKEPKKRSNLILVNDREIRVPDSEMLLLLYLVMELKKLDGGWVDRDRLSKEGITEENFPYRSIGRLRKTLAQGLPDGHDKRFIETKGDKSYRISTHPDFVIVEKRNWLPAKYNELKEARRRQVERAELQRKRSEEAARRRALSKQK